MINRQTGATLDIQTMFTSILGLTHHVLLDIGSYILRCRQPHHTWGVLHQTNKLRSVPNDETCHSLVLGHVVNSRAKVYSNLQDVTNFMVFFTVSFFTVYVPYRWNAALAFGLYCEFTQKYIQGMIVENKCTLYFHSKILHQISRLIRGRRQKTKAGSLPSNFTCTGNFCTQHWGVAQKSGQLTHWYIMHFDSSVMAYFLTWELKGSLASWWITEENLLQKRQHGHQINVKAWRRKREMLVSSESKVMEWVINNLMMSLLFKLSSTPIRGHHREEIKSHVFKITKIDSTKWIIWAHLNKLYATWS